MSKRIRSSIPSESPAIPFESPAIPSESPAIPFQATVIASESPALAFHESDQSIISNRRIDETAADFVGMYDALIQGQYYDSPEEFDRHCYKVMNKKMTRLYELVVESKRVKVASPLDCARYALRVCNLTSFDPIEFHPRPIVEFIVALEQLVTLKTKRSWHSVGPFPLEMVSMISKDQMHQMWEAFHLFQSEVVGRNSTPDTLKSNWPKIRNQMDRFSSYMTTLKTVHGDKVFEQVRMGNKDLKAVYAKSTLSNKKRLDSYVREQLDLLGEFDV